jgi:nucleotide-binding universal stress UspA family protein
MPSTIRTKRRRAPITAPRPTSGRILVATAGDRDSHGALSVVAALANRDASDVMLIGVSPPFPHNLSTLVSMRRPVTIDETSRRAVLEDLQDSARSLPGGDRWMKRAVSGFPADAIIDMASTWRASMIVLGLRHHSRLHHLFSAETAVDVMRHARIPVLAVPPTMTTLPTRALAAIDFSEASKAAAVTAARLLDADGTLTIAHVCAFGDVSTRDGDLIDLYRAGARTKLDEVVRELRRRTKRRVEDVMLTGEPAAAILGYARRTGTDLIALGGHELGLVDRILLGSVRTQIVRGARCSVLITPPETPPKRRRGA